LFFRPTARAEMTAVRQWSDLTCVTSLALIDSYVYVILPPLRALHSFPIAVGLFAFTFRLTFAPSLP
jgi:hypothetical protein